MNHRLVVSGIFALLFFAIGLQAGDFIIQADRLFARGDLGALQRFIESSSPTSDDERACRDYYRARLTIDGALSADRFCKVAATPSAYSEAAAVAYASWCLLQRDENETLTALNGIDSAEGNFWRTQAALIGQNNPLAAESARKILKSTSDSTRVEMARLFLAEAVFRQKAYQAGIDALLPFKRNNAAQLRVPALLKMAYGYERTGQIETAKECYRMVEREAPYTSAYFTADENLRRLGGVTVVGVPIPAKPMVKPVTKPQAKPVTPPAAIPKGAKIYLQAGVFGSKENARAMEKTLKSLGYKVTSFDRTMDGKNCRVVTVGPYPTEDKANAEQDKLKKKKIETHLIYR
jgi:tetratricopeptide (TPR) repeat protein